MRLDHLLSKEEEVRVLYTVESLSKPAQNGREEKMGKLAFTDSMNWRDALEDFAKRLRKRSFVRWRAKDEQAYKKMKEEIPVVMRLGETPVPIPNTKVKT